MAPKQRAAAKASAANAAPKSDPTQHLLVDDQVAETVTTPEPLSKQLDTSRPLAYPLPKSFSPATIANTESLLRFVILGLIAAAAVASRLFAVIRFESVIHEL